jgi:replicative DNA helicase
MILSASIYALKRCAKQMAQDRLMPLSCALDDLARSDGYQDWNHFVSIDAATDRAGKLLSRLCLSGLVLLAARPGNGKTILGLELLLKAIECGRDAHFFTLEYTKAEAEDKLRSFAQLPQFEALKIDTSNQLCAAHIVIELDNARPGTIAVIDYLQLLDQRRDAPPLAAQLSALKALASEKSLTLICLSQIDRSYDPASNSLPDLSHVRLPNSADRGLFDQTIFMGDDTLRLRTAA